jgi:hypothetical protein
VILRVAFTEVMRFLKSFKLGIGPRLPSCLSCERR